MHRKNLYSRIMQSKLCFLFCECRGGSFICLSQLNRIFGVLNYSLQGSPLLNQAQRIRFERYVATIHLQGKFLLISFQEIDQRGSQPSASKIVCSLVFPGFGEPRDTCLRKECLLLLAAFSCLSSLRGQCGNIT